jgi:mRNA-degrading endonuclease HigB of HigAB toxin-antitoxin module
MRVIKRGALVRFWQNHPDARVSLESWYAVAPGKLENARAFETGVPQRRFGRKKNSVQHRRQQVPFNSTSELPHPASLHPALIDTRGI